MDVPRHPPTPGAGSHLPMLLPRYTAAPRALAVAGDATRRSTLELVLRRQGYAVTHCSDPVVAMAVLRDRGGGFARVAVDMFPPRGGALELLECAIGEMRLHADAMSRAGDVYGPLVMEELDIFRQPITSKASNGSRSPEATPDSQSNGSVTATASTTPSPGRRAATRRRKRRRSRQPSETASQEVEQEREHGEPAVQQQQEQPAQRPLKKTRLVWTPELHDKFVDAHNKLLPSGDAVPKKILQLMNDKTLTRENVASHLQKYRLNLKQEKQQSLPKAKHQRASPSQASFLSPNMSQQHDILMAQWTVAAAAYGFNAQTMIRAPTVSGIQNNRQELHMQAFEDVNMNKECIVGTVHARDGSTGRVVVPKEMYSGAQGEHELDIDPKIVIDGPLNNSDRSFQEDLSTIIQQTLNKDPGPSWDYEFLHNSD